MGADCHQSTLTAQVVVKLILEIDEALVARLGKGNVAEHRTHYERTNLRGSGVVHDLNGGSWGGQFVNRHLGLSEEDVQGPRNSLDAEKIVSKI